MFDYIQKLLERREVRTVSREVDPKHELAAVLSRSQDESDSPILFRNVKGTDFPVIANVYGSHNRLCELLGTKRGDFCRRWHELSSQPFPSAGEYVKQVPESSDLIEINISDLPQLTYREKDGGAYISAGIFLAKHPETGVPNLSFSRCLMVNDNELRCSLGAPHDLALYHRIAESKNEPLEVAILIGPPPEIFLAACASLPTEADELAMASLLRGEPIPMRQCKTVDLMVPSETQVVIEARILPHKRGPEGPFGEFTGYYTEVEPAKEIVEVLRVVRQKEAYYQGLLCGSPDDLRPLELSFATRTYKHLITELPGILDVSCNPTSLNTTVQIKQMYEGHAKHVMLKVFGSNINYNNICVVVDEDVDIHDFKDVWWAFVTRARVDERLTVIPGVPGFYADDDRVYWGRLGIDATKPYHNMKAFERTKIIGKDDLDLSDYIDN